MCSLCLTTNVWTPFQINKFLAWRSWPAWWRSWRQTSGDTNQSNSCWDSHHHELTFIPQRNGEDCFIIWMNTVHNLYKYFLGLFKSIKYDIFKVFVIAWRYHLRHYSKILFWTQVLITSLIPPRPPPNIKNILSIKLKTLLFLIFLVM